MKHNQKSEQTKTRGFRTQWFRTESFVLVLLAVGLLKLIIFSAGVQAPNHGPAWWFLSALVFLIGNGSLLLLLLSPVFLFRTRRGQVQYGLSIHLILSLVILFNRLYNLFFQSYISLATLAHSGEGLSMIQALYSTFRFGEFLWLADVPLLAYLFSRMPGPRLWKQERPHPSWALRLAQIASLTVLIWTPFVSIYSGTGIQPVNIQIRETGILSFYAREATTFIPVVRDQPEALQTEVRIENWFELHREKRTGELYRGELEGRNVIFLQVEALQNIVVGKRINGQEITPNINRLIREGLYFSQCYDQVGMATADAEVLVSQSLYPLENVSVYLRYPENHFVGLPRVLRNEGYSTTAYHGHERTFYNRDQIYPSLGFSKFYGREQYIVDEEYGGLMGDRSFLQQNLPLIRGQEDPFFAFVITLTSHHPFNYLTEDDYAAIDVSEYEDSIVGDYIRSIHYTDDAIGRFVRMLEDEGYMEDTVLVLYGDHAAFNYNERDYLSLNRFFGVDVRDPEQQVSVHQVPVVVFAPGSSLSGTINQPIGMIDIFPTLGNLLGIDTPHVMGRDAFNTPEEPVILVGGSFVTEKLYYHGKTDVLYNLDTGEMTTDEKTRHWLAQIWETRDVARMIYETDFFAEQLSQSTGQID